MIERQFFKSDLAFERQIHWCPEIMTVMLYALKFCVGRGLRFMITESVTTVEEDKALNRQHDQHRKCVAADLSVLGWTPEDRAIVEKELDSHFSLLAYVTGSGKKEIAFCHNNGNGWHFHIAVNARYKLPEFKG